MLLPHPPLPPPADGLALGAAAGLSKADVELVIFLAIMLHKAPAAFGFTSFLIHEVGLVIGSEMGVVLIRSYATQQVPHEFKYIKGKYSGKSVIQIRCGPRAVRTSEMFR